MELLNERIRRLRTVKNLTVLNVSQKLGVSKSTYRDWEQGRKISGEPYILLAEIFEIDVYELLTGHKNNNITALQLKKIQSLLTEMNVCVDNIARNSGF